MENIVPLPAKVNPSGGYFQLTSTTTILFEPGEEEIQSIGTYLADQLETAIGLRLLVQPAGVEGAANIILLNTTSADPGMGEEGYQLTITPEAVRLIACHPAGLMRGVQTIRQLLPAATENQVVQSGSWNLATGTIEDAPRFAYRGMMLDVARHFFGVAEIKRLIDLIALYKLNILHLHLTDDQGWRLEIKSWPKLTEIGGSTAVGGDPGGFFTQQEYAEIVQYAQERYITIVPEIDIPGHTNAALASYPELNRDGKAPALYTGTEVGFSSLCIGNELTYQFLDDVIGEIAALTPGPFIHIGGDEALSTSDEEYRLFIEKIQTIVQKHGKQMVGWEEIGSARLASSSLAQIWKNQNTQAALDHGIKLIYSPASWVYLDMKYNPSSKPGQNWAGYVEVKDSYDWDPTVMGNGTPEENVLGVEAPLWTETIHTLDEIEFMAFPRLICLAELGWAPFASHHWNSFRARLGMQGPRLTAMGVNFYPAPSIDWKLPQ